MHHLRDKAHQVPEGLPADLWSDHLHECSVHPQILLRSEEPPHLDSVPLHPRFLLRLQAELNLLRQPYLHPLLHCIPQYPSVRHIER